MDGKALEWITAKAESTSEKIVRIVALVALIASALIALTTFQILFIVIAVVFAAAYVYLWMNQFIEYEFCYVIGELEIAKVYNHRRRKKKFSCKFEEIEYIVKGVKKEEGGQKFSFYVRGQEENVYTMVVNQEGKKSCIVMEAEEGFIKDLEKVWKVR